MNLWIIVYSFCIWGSWVYPDGKDKEACYKDMLSANVEFYSDQKAAMVEYKKLTQNFTVNHIVVYHVHPTYPRNSLGAVGCEEGALPNKTFPSCQDVERVKFVPEEPSLSEVVESTVNVRGKP